eukprot:gene7043-2772_t
MTRRPPPGRAVAALPERGRPVAQQYAIGDTWLTRFNRTEVCGADSPCNSVPAADAWDFYAVGPPLLLLAADLPALAETWAKRPSPPTRAQAVP